MRSRFQETPGSELNYSQSEMATEFGGSGYNTAKMMRLSGSVGPSKPFDKVMQQPIDEESSELSDISSQKPPAQRGVKIDIGS